jgi:hypothetical protein
MRLAEAVSFTLQLFAQMLGYRSFPGTTAVAVTLGTNAATLKTTAAVAYVSDGVAKQKAATDNIAIAAGTVVPKSSKCIFLLCLDAAGTFSTHQGAIVPATATPECPAVPSGKSPVGQMQVTTDANTTFTPGTTDDPTAGVTFAYKDLSWPDTGPSSLGVATASYPDFAAL